jgi:DNA-binding LytR/AlgR family response regulator
MIQIPASYYNYNHHLPFEWSQVQRLEGNGNYTVFVLMDGRTYTSTKSLGNYESVLPTGFIRIHKAHVVNVSDIVAIRRSRKEIWLKDGLCYEVSRRRWRLLVEILPLNLCAVVGVIINSVLIYFFQLLVS